ncbi:stem cell self-renewal protein Piwi domain-containing protein [Microcoleus sp. FACHB-831]|uniref:Piwi domain-containing protein n=1 Tax=Microcoleus sp. FACHB-831 TaxID=2692827 RepID=UPI001686DA9D|nr:Piwi domain-containing protein [Microcoleus sp. FACHB-831]MBD1919760.1 stem cell self-renewal protein Piwi domain-containing protein [Microcoleus sp. FACHB-831]
MSIFLNGFKVDLSAQSLKAHVQAIPNNQEVEPLRQALGDEWFLHWRQGKLYGIPRVITPQKPFGQPEDLNCNEHEHLQLLTSRISDLLPGIFSSYDPLKRRPFTFLAQRKELISAVISTIKNLPDIISSFKIFPKYILEPKIVELQDDKSGIGLFLRLKTNWQIQTSLSTLQNEGVDLQDLYVVRRCPAPRQRRLVGRVDRLSQQIVYLSESFDRVDSIAEEEVWLEGSKASFSRCLKAILGEQYEDFEAARTDQESQLLIGPALDTTLTEMQTFLVKKFPLQIAPDLQGMIGDRIEAINTNEYQSVVTASRIEYCFDAARTKRSPYAWLGIDKYGPFSRENFSKKTPEVIVFFPDTEQGAVENFLRALRDGISIKKKEMDEYNNLEWNETSKYTGGFAKIFGLVNPKFTLQSVPWFKNKHKPPADIYREAIEQTLASREVMPDAAIVVILDNQAQLPESANPYLNSKALLLMAGIPAQNIRLSKLNQPHKDLQYILQNLTVALYAKMNGTPWTVDHDQTITDELVIGVGTCELSGSRFTERQRFVGITTVFRADGNYLLGNLSKECSYAEYPNVLKNSTLSILQDIKNQNNWRPGDTIRLVFHAARPLKNVDIAEIIAQCVAKVGSEQNIEFAFLTVSHDHPFTVLDKSQQGIVVKNGVRKGIYAPERGTILQLGRYTRLLSTNSPRLIKRPSTPLPTPLLIHLHPQSTYYDLTYLSEQVLKFTSLSWKSVFPASDPVTIYYSELIAGLLARLKNVRGWSPAMLNIKLRASKWFL